jgi:tetratricopeptide (TPR) repeat protein
MAKSPTENIEAYHDFQKGKHILENFPASSNREKSLLTAAKFFRNAIKKDKKFALAYAYLGKTNFFLTYHKFINEAEGLFEIQILLQTAFSLEANLSEAFELQGIIQMVYEFDFKSAEISLKRANEINPNNAYPFHMLSLLQCILQKFDESIFTQIKAIQLDPSSISYNVGLANRFYFAGEYEKTIVQANEVLDLETNSAPAFLIKALALSQLESFSDAFENIEKANALYPSNEYYTYKIYLMALSGNKDESSRLLEEYLKDKTEEELNVENIAIIYAVLGKYDEAIYYVEKTLKRKIFYSFFLPFDPGFKLLWNNEKFKELMKNLFTMLSANY